MIQENHIDTDAEIKCGKQQCATLELTLIVFDCLVFIRICICCVSGLKEFMKGSMNE